MKNIIAATLASAALLAPSVSLAQNLIIGFPGIQTEFSSAAQVTQPVAKLNISTSNEPVVKIKAITQK